MVLHRNRQGVCLLHLSLGDRSIEEIDDHYCNPCYNRVSGCTAGYLLVLVAETMLISNIVLMVPGESIAFSVPDIGSLYRLYDTPSAFQCRTIEYHDHTAFLYVPRLSHYHESSRAQRISAVQKQVLKSLAFQPSVLAIKTSVYVSILKRNSFICKQEMIATSKTTAAFRKSTGSRLLAQTNRASQRRAPLTVVIVSKSCRQLILIASNDVMYIVVYMYTRSTYS